MARSLRPDIPSRRACNVLSQVTPGMADLNPAPGVGRSGPPPLGTLDQAPLGTFQANRALNGEQGVAARQRARLRHSASTAPTRVPSPHEWDPDAFPMDHNLFGEDLRGHDGMDTIQRHPVGGELPFAGSARLCQNFGLEGGGTVIPRGLGPVPPRSPVSDDHYHLNPNTSLLSCLDPVNSPITSLPLWLHSTRFFSSYFPPLLWCWALAAPAPPTPPSTQSTQPTQPIEFDLSLRRVIENSKKPIFLKPDNLRPNEACSFQFMPATASDTNKHPITFEPEKEAFELQEQILGSTGTQQGQLADRGIEGPNLLEALSNWVETADGFRFTANPSGIEGYTMLQELRIAKETPQIYENWDVE
ncbi:hypothetical protein EV360DRAFT_89579 [Lentinula raphanica]|nr:hypothetical protein EV360DRAFT_89579 [Lentinula raphanica]